MLIPCPQISSATENKQSTTAPTQHQINDGTSHLSHSRILKPSRIPAPRSCPPLTEDMSLRVLPLSREWTSFPRSQIIDLELQRRHTVSKQQYYHDTKPPPPNPGSRHGYGVLESKSYRKRLRDRLQALSFKLVSNTRNLIAETKRTAHLQFFPFRSTTSTG